MPAGRRKGNQSSAMSSAMDIELGEKYDFVCALVSGCILRWGLAEGKVDCGELLWCIGSRVLRDGDQGEPAGRW